MKINSNQSKSELPYLVLIEFYLSVITTIFPCLVILGLHPPEKVSVDILY